MKSQVMQAALARIEAIARNALTNEGRASALVDILRVIQSSKDNT